MASPPTGAEAGLAEQIKGQPPEPAEGGGETLWSSLEAVCHRQTGPWQAGEQW